MNQRLVRDVVVNLKKVIEMRKKEKANDALKIKIFPFEDSNSVEIFLKSLVFLVGMLFIIFFLNGLFVHFFIK